MASRHVALIAFPFASHVGTLFALAQALAAAAPKTTFSFISTAGSLASLAPSAAAHGNIRLCPVADGCPSPLPGDVEVQIRLFLEATPGNLRDALRAAAVEVEQTLSCVVSDAFMWMAVEVAEEMGVPWVALWPGNPACLWAHLHTDEIRDATSRNPVGTNETLPVDIPGLSGLRLRDLPPGIVSDGGLDSGVPRLLHRMCKELHRCAAMVFNSFQGFDPTMDTLFGAKFKDYLPVGPIEPLNAPGDAFGCIPWLEQQAPNSVAYVSFSTIMSPSPAELAGLAAGLEASGVLFLWSMKEALQQHLPVGFLERTRGRALVVPWAPQGRVLRHAAVGLLVTHCGWNSVAESILGGVPMACRPFYGDQMMTERTVSEVLGIGVGFEGGVMTRESTATALNLMLKGDQGKKIRERMRHLSGRAAKAVAGDGSSANNITRLLEIAGTQATPKMPV